MRTANPVMQCNRTVSDPILHKPDTLLKIDGDFRYSRTKNIEFGTQRFSV